VATPRQSGTVIDPEAGTKRRFQYQDLAPRDRSWPTVQDRFDRQSLGTERSDAWLHREAMERNRRPNGRQLATEGRTQD